MTDRSKTPVEADVDALRRRAAELSALFSSARELAAVSDTDAVLERLVARAHDMLAGDVTYLSEFAPDTRELQVRATSGAVSSAFRELVVPPGAGLVSQIVESRMPQAVSRYADLRADRHAGVVDDAVHAEGIVALLGVPLRTETSVLGVLFVAMRQERTFTAEEIALLSALADHASVVLQSAAHVRELRRSEEEARAALAQLSEHLAERERAHTVHQRLVGAVLDGGGFAPIAETLASTFARAVSIVDERGDERASAGDTSTLQQRSITPPVQAAIEQSRTSGRAVTVAGDRGQIVVASLTAGPRGFGAILVGAGRSDLGAVDLRTIERAAQVSALLALSEEAVADAAHRQQADLVADLAAGGPERRADVTSRLRRLGFEPDGLDTVVAIVVPGGDRATVARALVRALDGAGLVGEVDGLVLALFDRRRTALDAGALRDHAVAATGGCVLAVVAPTTPAGARLDGVRRSARILVALGAVDGVVAGDELLPYAAVLDTDHRALDAFLDMTIGVVRRSDRERGTELLATLRAFVRNGASPTKTARALTFHTNTILQRLDRLDTLLGAGWRGDEALFRISLAVRLDELRERVTAPDRWADPPRSASVHG